MVQQGERGEDGAPTDSWERRELFYLYLPLPEIRSDKSTDSVGLVNLDYSLGCSESSAKSILYVDQSVRDKSVQQ